MNNLQMLKKAMLAYVSAVKFIWSEIAYPLSIVGKKFMNLRGYRVYGNSIQDGTPTPETPVEIQSVGDLTKNLFDTQGWYSWLRTFTTTYVQKQVVDGISCIYYRPSSTFNKEYMKGQFKVNTRYTISFRAKGIIGTDYSTGFRFMYTDGTSTSVSVSNDDTWNEYTLTSISGKTIDNIQMFLNYPQGCYFDENSIQLEEGTTATDYEPYHKYKIPVVARGKNMFDGSSSEGNGKYLNSNGVLGSGIDNLRVTDYITIPSGVSSLTFSFKGEVMNYPSICLYDDSKNYITGKRYGGIRNTNISVPSNAKYVRCSYRTVNTDIQLEGGSTKTEYEPYIATVTTNIYLNEPLRKVGNYADYIDFEKQKVVRRIEVMTLDGDESRLYTLTPTRPQEGYSCYRYMFSVAQGSWACLCDKIPYKEGGYSAATSGTCISFNSTRINLIFKIPTDWASTVDELKTWLAANPCTVYYVINPSIEETVTLPVLPQFKGTTIYEVGTNIKPSGMEAKYC